MCHIFVKPLGISNLPTDEEIKVQWRFNSDGAGYSISRENSGVLYKKGLMKLSEVLELLQEMRREGGIDKYAFCLHLRFGTHGDVCKELTHPFPIDDENFILSLGGTASHGVLFHNGVLNGLLQDKSDTVSLVRNYLPSLNQDYSSLEGNIGHNKLVFALPKGEVKIINKNKGQTVNGIWNSNPVYY